MPLQTWRAHYLLGLLVLHTPLYTHLSHTHREWSLLTQNKTPTANHGVNGAREAWSAENSSPELRMKCFLFPSTTLTSLTPLHSIYISCEMHYRMHFNWKSISTLFNSSIMPTHCNDDFPKTGWSYYCWNSLVWIVQYVSRSVSQPSLKFSSCS